MQTRGKTPQTSIYQLIAFAQAELTGQRFIAELHPQNVLQNIYVSRQDRFLVTRRCLILSCGSQEAIGHQVEDRKVVIHASADLGPL